MNQESIDASIDIMGKAYQIKCPQSEIQSLQNAAHYLEEKMRTIKESGVLSIDRLAIITALNIVHQLLTLEQKNNHTFQMINQRINTLQSKVDSALVESAQMEFLSAE